ncbi:hypothetical protein [Actinoplanes solisilvae]|uniref:hypothetical protein n=1 Tax=Actinoplanes solisilvae TaxID=2486853 RepID=UPI000FDB16DC|nr:hypothetical protein [Actinoplanes solisilvae]
MTPRFTLEAAARALVGRLAPAELDALPMISAGFHHDRDVRRRITYDVLRARAAGPEAVAPVAVVLLNALATDLLAGWAGDDDGLLGRWRRRRAVAASIDRPAAPESELPHLEGEQAARVALRCREFALLSGLPEVQAETMARLIAEMLVTAPVG